MDCNADSSFALRKEYLYETCLMITIIQQFSKTLTPDATKNTVLLQLRVTFN